MTFPVRVYLFIHSYLGKWVDPDGLFYCGDDDDNNLKTASSLSHPLLLKVIRYKQASSSTK